MKSDCCKPFLKKILIGNISVDSGIIWIGDPCYLSDISLDDITYAIQKAWSEKRFYESLKFNLGHEGAGIVSSTYDGDGHYPVYGYFKDNDKRPIGIYIDFVGTESNEPDYKFCGE